MSVCYTKLTNIELQPGKPPGIETTPQLRSKHYDLGNMNRDSSLRIDSTDPKWQTKKRRSLTVAEKNQIHQFHKDNPLVTHKDLAAKFGVERSTVSKIVHQSHYAAALESNGQTWNPQHCTPTTTDHASLVERQLVEWTQEVRRAGLSVTRDMIRAQAAVLANKSPSHFLQSVPAASLPQTPPSSVFDAGSTSTLGTYSDPAYTAETSGTDCDIDLLAHELAAIQEEDCSRTPPGQIQNDYLYNVLDYSGAHDPALSLYATSPLSQPYDKGVHPRPICSSSHEKMSDAVCLSEARRAIDTVESYISNTPMVTALDQLCLNHVKTCLYRP